MGVITNQPNTQQLSSCEKREKRKVKMCDTHQQNPQQNQPWQGVYPDLSALNELFSPQATVNSETSSSSPWIAFLSSLGLQPIPGPQQQAEMLLPMGLPEDVRVIAWGLSLERPTMIKYGIDNIRDLVGHKVDLDMVQKNPLCRI